MKNKIDYLDIFRLIEESEMEYYIFWNKEVVASYKLKNGFTVTGRAACVDPANFDLEIGLDIAKKDVVNQMWELEGYILQQKLYEASLI